MGVKLATYAQMKAAGFSGGKTICPKCAQKVFVPFIDERTGAFIDVNRYGRCERVNECNYYFYPEDHFKKPENLKKASAPVPTVKNIIIDAPGRLPFSYVIRSLSTLKSQNNFILYLLKLFDENIVNNILNEYYLGETKKGNVIFWQIDEQNEVRTGKIIPYGTDGRRLKNARPPINWTHKKLYDAYNLEQCLFGLHLVNKYKDKPILIFESEKTALIASVYAEICFGGALCLATGGVENLSPEKFDALKGRKITLAPDSGALKKWTEKVEKLNRSDFQSFAFWDLEHKESGADFADFITTNKNGKALVIPIDVFNKTEFSKTVATRTNQNNQNESEKPEKKHKKPKPTDKDESIIFEREREAARALITYLESNENGVKKISGRRFIFFVCDYLKNIWAYRYHTLQGFQLKDGEKYRNIERRDVCRMRNIIESDFNTKVSIARLSEIIYGENEATIHFDPIRSYFNEITDKYDLETARAAFEEFTKLTYDRIDPEQTSFEHWRRTLYVWTAFSVAQIFDDIRVNDIALVFVSQTQGTGKTLIANALSKPAAELDLLSEPDFEGGRESERKLYQNWILFDDELSRRRKADVAAFKKYLSAKKVSFVEKYETNNITRQRICSFILCGNDIEYLSEFSRREAIIPFKETRETSGYYVKLAEKLNKKDLIDKIWTFAFLEWKKNKKHASNERAELENAIYARSEAFLATTVERDLLKEYFAPASKSAVHKKGPLELYDTETTDENEFIIFSLTDILSFLSKKVPSIRLEQRNMLSAIKSENLGKSQNNKINRRQKIGYRLRLIKV